MTYYPDLSPYQYRETSTPAQRDREPPVYGVANTVNVGWLDGAEPFSTGETSGEFRERLLEFCLQGHDFNLTRGPHSCNLPECPVEPDRFGRRHPPPVRRGKQTAYQGSSEIRVVGEAAIYAAPTMIYHYVVDHNYQPPDEFVEAVLNGPKPGTDEYWKQLEKLAGPG
jgi:hypothetical protein